MLKKFLKQKFVLLLLVVAFSVSNFSFSAYMLFGSSAKPHQDYLKIYSLDDDYGLGHTEHNHVPNNFMHNYFAAFTLNISAFTDHVTSKHLVLSNVYQFNSNQIKRSQSFLQLNTNKQYSDNLLLLNASYLI